MDDRQRAQWLERLDDLISGFDAVPITQGTHVGEYYTGTEWAAWWTAAASALTTLLGPDHLYVKTVLKCANEDTPSGGREAVGVLLAVRGDVERGYLTSVELQITADVFSDFLDMSGQLLDAGYKDPAAMITGAVLEDGLKRLARLRGITVRPQDDITSVNQKLAEATVYNRLQQKEVHTWGAVRNHADHAEWDQYNAEQVRSMLDGVTRFLVAHLN